MAIVVRGEGDSIAIELLVVGGETEDPGEVRRRGKVVGRGKPARSGAAMHM